MVETGIIDILKDKKIVKTLLAKRLGFSVALPLVIFKLKEGGDEEGKLIIKSIIDSWCEVFASAIILGEGGYISEKKNVVILSKHRGVDESEVLVAGDIIVDLSDLDIETILFNRLVPVSMKKIGLSDYSPVRETGNAFIYKKRRALAIFGALNRALETTKLKYDWKHIVKDLV